MNVGIIGCGAISSLHIRSFKEIIDTKIIAVADINPEYAKRTGQELQVDYYQDYEQLLARDDIHVVSICTLSGLHEEVAVKAAMAKKYVIVEKPIGVILQKNRPHDQRM